MPLPNPSPPRPPESVLRALEVRGSFHQIQVVGPSGTAVQVSAPGGEVVADGVVDSFGDRLASLGVTNRVTGLGGFIAFDLAPARYEVRTKESHAAGGGEARHHVQVMGPTDLPDDYEDRVLGQELDAGFGYLEVRDGTLLSVNVGLPDADRWGPGPYPTVIQYSGYCPSRPDFLTGDPQLDTGMNTEANVIRHLGFAVVGVNMRGSGASGGEWDLLCDHAGIDGHDAVEVVARQRWAARHPSGRLAVGMIGRSMPGFSQLLVASTQPPSLAAITPAAVTGSPYDSGTPGGVPNTWLLGTVRFWEVEPPPPPPEAEVQRGSRYEVWDDWIADHIAAGDLVCARNQLLRGHNNDILTPGPRAREPVAADAWVSDITAPTLLMGAWQDQDSGSGFAFLPQSFPPDTHVEAVFTNGTHEESRFPELMGRWIAFLAEHLTGGGPPWTSNEAQAYLDERYHTFPAGLPLDLPSAGPERPKATLLVELGAAPGRGPGYPYPAAEIQLDSWPPPVEAHVRHLAPDGSLLLDAPAAGTTSAFTYDPRAKAPSCNPRRLDLNDLRPALAWHPPPTGKALEHLTEPLATPTFLAGDISVDLWVCVDAPDVDLEVSLSEVRPDGWETYVQGGWLRASHRALDEPRSTELLVWPADTEPVPLQPGVPTLLRIGIRPVAHLFRAGSRIRLGIEAPGGNQPSWTFDALWPDGRYEGRPVTVQVLQGGEHPSRMVLALLPGVEPADGWPPLPPPGVLRNQATRRHRPL